MYFPCTPESCPLKLSRGNSFTKAAFIISGKGFILLYSVKLLYLYYSVLRKSALCLWTCLYCAHEHSISVGVEGETVSAQWWPGICVCDTWVTDSTWDFCYSSAAKGLQHTSMFALRWYWNANNDHYCGCYKHKIIWKCLRVSLTLSC